jgi:hypothetical protein
MSRKKGQITLYGDLQSSTNKERPVCQNTAAMSKASVRGRSTAHNAARLPISVCMDGQLPREIVDILVRRRCWLIGQLSSLWAIKSGQPWAAISATQAPGMPERRENEAQKPACGWLRAPQPASPTEPEELGDQRQEETTSLGTVNQ